MVRVHSGLPFFSPSRFSTCDFLPVFNIFTGPAKFREQVARVCCSRFSLPETSLMRFVAVTD
jgi:hypothetical protein